MLHKDYAEQVMHCHDAAGAHCVEGLADLVRQYARSAVEI